MKYWYSQNIFAWLLWPLSLLFCLLVSVRRQCYLSGMFKSHQVDVPVVIVGNISVGGSGKTPLLIALCAFLKAHGKKPGVVSRGYGGSFTGVKQLDKTTVATEAGDEPVMIFQRSRVPVVVGADRPAAVDYLLANNDCDIVLSDDGLQHYRLGRTVEIAVVDAKRLQGNGFCLPAGPLRESARRLKNVDLIVYNGQPGNDSAGVNNFYQLAFEQAVNLVSGEKKSLQALNDQPVIAVAAIGYPERFFKLLTDEGLLIQPQAYPDHYAFTDKDINAWSGKCVLMTEKDAVKCQPYLQSMQHSNDGSWRNIWYLPVTAKLDAQLKNMLEKKLL